jgi:receptor expression-enhancing protein 1/2/3/4
MVFYFITLVLSSIVGFLFPIYASYKALKTSDPAQLTPWLMYWAVFGCGLLVESWTEWILGWVPFYYMARLMVLLYLVSPQTQGARHLYETYVHRFIEDNENQIDEFIVRTHERMRTAGMEYVQQAIELFKTKVLGMPPSEPSAASTPTPGPTTAQSYTQALLARFSVPATRWSPAAPAAGTGTGTDFYNLLAGAVSSLAAGAAAQSTSGLSAAAADVSRSGTLIPPEVRGASERMSFIAAQRSRLNILLGALDREAQQLQREETLRGDHTDGEGDHSPWHSPLQRPASGLSGFSGASGASGLSKSRSEADFEKIDVDSSGPEDEGVRRRHGSRTTSGSSGWMPWGWVSSPTEPDKRD